MTINGQAINASGINGGAQSQQEVVELWRRNDAADVIYLVELDYIGDMGGTPHTYTLRLSNRARPPYLPLLISVPSFGQQIGDNFTGAVTASYGTLEIRNIDGAQDAWARLNIDGQRCHIRYGDPSWPDDMFLTVVQCVAEIVSSASRDKITIRLRDAAWNSNLPVQTTLITNAAGLSNIPRPICLGNTYQISPVVTDQATQTYAWHDPAFGVNTLQQVYDSGAGFGGTSQFSTSAAPATNIINFSAAHGLYIGSRIQIYDAISYPPPTPLAELVDYWVIADSFTATQFKLSATRGGTEIDITGTTNFRYRFFHWTSDDVAGNLYLASAPAGKLTASSYSYDANAPKTAGQMLAKLLLGRLDSASVNASGGANSWHCGIYIKDRQNRLDIANALVQGLSSWYGADRYGVIKLGRVERTNTAYDAALTEQDGVDVNSLTIERMIMPRKNHRIGYRKNWTVQTSGVASGLGANGIADLAAPESYTTIQALSYAGAGDVTNHALAVIPDAISSYINVGGEATGESFIYGEASRLDAMYQGWGVVFAWEIKKIGFELDIGQIVRVTHSQFELSGGVNMTIVGIERKPASSTVALKLYVGRDTYTPGQL